MAGFAGRSHFLRPCVRAAAVVATESEAGAEQQSTPPAWYEDSTAPELAPPPPPSAPLAPEGSPATELTVEDLVNTRWTVKTVNREDGWLGPGGQEQEYTLLEDGSVVWGGQAGGFGTGGRWTLRDGILEVIRTTPLGLVTGRDYYMSTASAVVGNDLKMTVTGIIRSYNVLFPVAVVADYEAKRLPGRFVRNQEEDA